MTYLGFIACWIVRTTCAHQTCVCSVQVGGDGTHGLACRKSAGRQMRHKACHAHVPSLAKPNSLCRDDGKRPDGLTVLPWANGRCLVWVFTCPDTLAASHLNRAVMGSGVVANDAESRKFTNNTRRFPSFSHLPFHFNYDLDIGCAGRRSVVILP